MLTLTLMIYALAAYVIGHEVGVWKCCRIVREDMPEWERERARRNGGAA